MHLKLNPVYLLFESSDAMKTRLFVPASLNYAELLTDLALSCMTCK